MPWDTIDSAYRDPAVQRGMALIGAAVRRRRERLGWSQRDLERRTRVDQTTISRLENGRRVGLRLARLARLVAALGGLDFDVAHVNSAHDHRPKPTSIRSMYAQIEALREQIYQARIEARVRQIEAAEIDEIDGVARIDGIDGVAGIDYVDEVNWVTGVDRLAGIDGVAGVAGVAGIDEDPIVAIARSAGPPS